MELMDYMVKIVDKVYLMNNLYYTVNKIENMVND